MRALCQRQHPRDTAFIQAGLGCDKYAENQHHRKVCDGAQNGRYRFRDAAHRVQHLRTKAFHIFSRNVEPCCFNPIADCFNLPFDNGLKACGLRGEFGACENKRPIDKTKHREHDNGQAEAARDGQHPAKKPRAAV